MLDRKKLRRKVLLDLATAPVVLIPFLIGASALIIMWTLSISSSVLSSIAAVALLGSLGLFITTFLLGDESVAKKAIQRLKAEEERKEDRELDELDERLVKDRDPRTQKLLRDIRQLVSKFKDEDLIGDIEANTLFEIVSGVQELFDSSVKSLKTALELHETAREIDSISAKSKIMDRREQILYDIEKNVEQLGSILADMQTMDLSDKTDMSKLRAQLAEDVDTAKRVKEKIADMEFGLDSLSELRNLRNQDTEAERV